MHTTTTEKNIHAREPKKETLHEEKISCTYTSQEENFLVHERVKKIRAYNQSPTHTLSKVKLATTNNHYINCQLLVFSISPNLDFVKDVCPNMLIM